MLIISALSRIFKYLFACVVDIFFRCTTTYNVLVDEDCQGSLTIKSDMTLFMKCDLVCIIIARGALSQLTLGSARHNVTSDA